MGNHVVPDLQKFRAYLFDLDGVLTPTAELHMQAWQRTFDEVFTERGITPAYTSADYFAYVDGKKRADGVEALLRSRGVELPLGFPQDPPSAVTLNGVGNRKNAVFGALLRDGGIAPFPGSRQLLDALSGEPLAVVSSSKNAEEVLRSAGIRDRFSVVVDGMTAEREHLPSKPDPAVFLRGAELLGVDPADAVAFEDAVSGVASAAGGGFGLVIGVDRGAGADALIAAGAHRVVSDLAELLTDEPCAPRAEENPHA